MGGKTNKMCEDGRRIEHIRESQNNDVCAVVSRPVETMEELC